MIIGLLFVLWLALAIAVVIKGIADFWSGE
jgi:hypothetical protein